MINPFYIPIINIITENNIEYHVYFDSDIYEEKWYLADTHILSRERGPAITRKDGTQTWWYNGKYFHTCFSQKEFVRMLNLKIFW